MYPPIQRVNSQFVLKIYSCAPQGAPLSGIGINMLKTFEISRQEAAWYFLNLNLCHSRVIWTITLGFTVVKGST